MSTKVRRKGRTVLSRISSKNQITIPVDLLDAAGLVPGDVVRFINEGPGQLRIVKQGDPFWDMVGSEPGLSTEFDLESLRDEWQR